MNARILPALLALAAGTLIASPSHAAAMLKCTMRFDLASWSILYKHASGTGTVSCSDGSHLKVKLTANGGGLAVGNEGVEVPSRHDAEGGVAGHGAVEPGFGRGAAPHRLGTGRGLAG